MTTGRRIIGAQLRVDDSELTSRDSADILKKIDAARDLAGLGRLLFRLTPRRALNDAILSHCRKRGIEIYLWHTALANTPIIPEREELVENAWGGRGVGESGVWSHLSGAEENYIFACPRNAKYTQLLLSRCAQALPDFDGLFLDCSGFPLPSQGIEAIFSCFCPSCMEVEPRLAEWRRRAVEMREYAASASDAELRKWGTFTSVLSAFGLWELFEFRRQSATLLAKRYADLAKRLDKPFALDLVCPALSLFAAHDYAELGKLADWIKPRVYYRVFGPSSIPLEFYCFTMGMMSWGKRYTIPEVLAYIARSTGLEMPASVHALSQDFLPPRAVFGEIARAEMATPCPIHPGIEFSPHPDYDTGLDRGAIKAALDAARHSPGFVMSWNLMYIPDEFLRFIGEENESISETVSTIPGE